MNTSLTVLIEGDAKACQYFNALPAPVRAQLNGQRRNSAALTI
jgi:hypothetical protein